MISRRVRLTVEFDGTDFYGWQRQPTGERTVQGSLESAFARLPGPHGSVVGAGRTDRGVHGLAIVAHCDTTSPIPDENLRLALNAHLPPDAKILSLETVDEAFHAQFSCQFRRYVYRIGMMRGDPRGVALTRNRVMAVHVPLDVASMQRACQDIEGTHDFSSFATQETRNTIKTVYLCEIREVGTELQLHIAADGFLRNMIRAIVGTLLLVGKGTLPPDAIPAILAQKDRTKAGANARPEGLYFVEAGYEPWNLDRSESGLTEMVW